MIRYDAEEGEDGAAFAVANSDGWARTFTDINIDKTSWHTITEEGLQCSPGWDSEIQIPEYVGDVLAVASTGALHTHSRWPQKQPR